MSALSYNANNICVFNSSMQRTICKICKNVAYCFVLVVYCCYNDILLHSNGICLQWSMRIFQWMPLVTWRKNWHRSFDFAGVICCFITPPTSFTNRVAALTSRDGILWVQGIPDVKKRYWESIENAYYRLNKGCRRDKFVIRSVTDVLRTQSRFVKCVGGSACGLTPHKFYKPTLGPKYVRNRPYN